MLIFAEKITKRLKYIFRLLLEEQLGLEFEITSQNDKFLLYPGPKFSYGDQPLGDELFFASKGLLFEIGIKSQEPAYFDYEGNKSCFPVYNKSGALPFDIFAASFYLVTRYEEYLPHIKDEYGRFQATESDAYKHNFLQKPLVNIWSQKISKILSTRFPEIVIKPKQFKFIPTIDIDSAYAFRLKGLIRIMGGFSKSLVGGDFEEFNQRIRVLSGKEKDPFDTFDYQLEIHNKYNLEPKYFLLLANYAQYDKNVPVHNRQFQILIKTLADYAVVGIHPSYESNNRLATLREEVNRLSKILNRPITMSRQHFLKLSLPETYRNLISLDITDDYSMGFAFDPGFRAGIADSFGFYDLDLESETNLRIHPFTVMDGTLRDYKNLNATESIDMIKKLIDEVKAVNGTFISLWHNESLSDQKRWTGWRKVYEEMISYATAQYTWK